MNAVSLRVTRFGLALIVVWASTAPLFAADPTLLAFGQNVYQKINASLKKSGSSLYAEAATVNGTQSGGDGGYAYVWPMATQFRVLTDLVRIDAATYSPALHAFADELQTRYWRNGTGAAGGYRSGVSSGADLFYDDNGHLVVCLAEAYQLTHESQYLERAVQTYAFVMSGEDSAGGGGIYFSVTDRNSKDAISTLQGARGGLMLYLVTGQAPYLTDATRLYTWATMHIQQSNGLFRERFKLTGTNANQPDGATLINSAGIGLSCNLLFYDATGNVAYLHEAQRVGHASMGYFDGNGAIRDEGFWAFELVDALNDLYRRDADHAWLTAVRNALVWLHTNREDPNGHYGKLWSRDTYTLGTIRVSWELNDQAAVARSYLHTALADQVSKTFVTAPGDIVSGFYQASVGGGHVVSSAGSGAGQYPATEVPAGAIDGTASTKYLNFGNGNSATSSATKGVGTGFCVTPAATYNGSLVTGIQVITANDAPNRDPLRVSIEGTNAAANFNQGATWTLIADNVNLGIDTDPGRRTYGPPASFSNTQVFSSYRVIVKAQRGSDNGVQYAEMNLIGTLVDRIPPSPVTNLAATVGNDRIALSWKNPPEADLAGIKIVYKTSGYPASASDGTLLVDRSGIAGADDQYAHADARCGTTYYYAIFAYDQAANVSSISMAPLARIQCGDFDLDQDVDLSDFGLLQQCLAGAGLPYAAGCAPADLNRDGHVDSRDTNLFRGCFSGPNRPPGC